MAQRKRSHPPDANVPDIPPLPDGTSATSVEGVTRLFLKRTADAVRRLSLWSEDNYGATPPKHASTHLVDGSDPLEEPATPNVVVAGTTGDLDTGSGPSYMREDAQLVALSTTPSGLANTNVEGTATTVLRGDAQFKRDIRVKSAGVDVGTRNAVNIVSGATVVDNAGSDRVDITIPAGPGAILTDYGLIAWDGATTVQRGLPAALNGNVLWIDARDTEHIGAGDSVNMPGWPWLGHWIRDSALVNNTAFEVFRVTMPNDTDEWSGHIAYTAVGSDGTDLHKEVGEINVSAIRDSASVVDAVVGSSFGVLQHVPTGSIVVTWSASVSVADAIFSCTINSSLTTDVWLEFRLQADNNAQTVTFVQT